MSSRSGAPLRGVQEPRFCNAPRAKWSQADDCAFLASAYGLRPDPWQSKVLRAWLGETNDGRWLAGRCGLSVPRQNGKNAILEMVELYFMVALGLKILHTAHEVKTARKAFTRLKGFFENERQWPELARLVKEIRQTNGQEAIVLHAEDCEARRTGSKADCQCRGGGAIEFVARSRGSGRGYTVDVLVCDEAQELTDEQLEALLPTISSAPSGNPLQVYTGTPPPPGSPGTVFRRMRDQGVLGKDKRLSWVEWSVPEIGNVRDRARWTDTNPALGYRLQLTVIEDEIEQLTEEGFARERLGWWTQHSVAKRAIQDKVWDPLRHPAPRDGRIALGVKFSLDGKHVAAAVARRTDTKTHVEVLGVWPAAEGLALLTPLLAESWRDLARIVIDGKSGAGGFRQALLDEKVGMRAVVLPSVAEVQTAHSLTLSAIEDGTLSHANQPGLNAAVKVATKRPIGSTGGWGWEAIGDGDVLALDAATFALWGAVTSRKKTTNSGWRVVIP